MIIVWLFIPSFWVQFSSFIHGYNIRLSQALNVASFIAEIISLFFHLFLMIQTNSQAA